jgi:hypothetical protein
MGRNTFGREAVCGDEVRCLGNYRLVMGDDRHNVGFPVASACRQLEPIDLYGTFHRVFEGESSMKRDKYIGESDRRTLGEGAQATTKSLHVRLPGGVWRERRRAAPTSEMYEKGWFAILHGSHGRWHARRKPLTLS